MNTTEKLMLFSHQQLFAPQLLLTYVNLARPRRRSGIDEKAPL